MLQDFIIIVQSNLPISTAAPTHYASFSTLISYTLFQNIFQQLFGHFFWPQGLLPTIFEFPFPATRAHTFPDVSTSFLTLSSGD